MKSMSSESLCNQDSSNFYEKVIHVIQTQGVSFIYQFNFSAVLILLYILHRYLQLFCLS